MLYFFPILRWLFNFLVINHHSLHLIPSIKNIFAYFSTYSVSICSITWIKLPEIFQILHFLKKCSSVSHARACVCIFIPTYDVFQAAQHIAKNMTMRKPLTDFITVNWIESYCKSFVFYISSISRLKLIADLCLCQTVCRTSK